jgi:hypothetical protein
MMNYPQWMAPYINANQTGNVEGRSYGISPGVNPVFGTSLIRMGVNPDQSPYLRWLGVGSNSAQSMVNRNNSQPYQYNAPTAQQMFPGMGNPMIGTMPNQSQGDPMLGGGLFGAGRFLGGNYANQAGLLGTSVSGT